MAFKSYPHYWVIFRDDLEGKSMDNSHWHLQTLWEARTNYLFSYWKEVTISNIFLHIEAIFGREERKHSKGRLRTTSDLWYQKRTSKAGNLKRPGQIRFNNRFRNQEQTRLHKRYTLLLVLFPLVIRRKAIFEVVFKSRQLCQVK